MQILTRSATLPCRQEAARKALQAEKANQSWNQVQENTIVGAKIAHEAHLALDRKGVREQENGRQAWDTLQRQVTVAAEVAHAAEDALKVSHESTARHSCWIRHGNGNWRWGEITFKKAVQELTEGRR